MKKKKEKMAWSKKLLIILFINFFLLEGFIGWVTAYSFRLSFITGTNPDFTPLITLMGAVLGQTISYGIYCAKSKAENTQGGVIYDLAMQNNQQGGENNGDYPI